MTVTTTKPNDYSTAIGGLYGITDCRLISDKALIERCEQALDGGCQVLQYRNKQASESLKRQQALELRKLCETYGKIFIVNDSPKLAQDVDAHGIHLGQQDMPIEQARRFLGDTMIIGATCHNSIALAETALEQGADYLAFGRFFQSQTKPDAPEAKLDLLSEASSIWPQTSIVAIGGLTFDNALDVIRAGASSVAVCHELFASDCTKRQAERLSSLFDQHLGS